MGYSLSDRIQSQLPKLTIGFSGAVETVRMGATLALRLACVPYQPLLLTGGSRACGPRRFLFYLPSSYWEDQSYLA